MALNDCWWWPSMPSGPPPRRPRTHDIAFGAIGVLIFIVAGAFTWNGYKALQRWSAEQDRIAAEKAAQVEATIAVVKIVADGECTLGQHRQDIWGTPLRLKGSNGLWDTFTVTSAGPDLTFDTADDIF